MGIPAFFRWLQRKYPHMVEPFPDNNQDPATRQPIWFDNLYLDMNNIIHPCTHPEDKPPPQTEDEMFAAIFEYTEKVMAMVKPRHLVYLAIDGVAPRAKMNQQRTRRFRAVQESEEKRIQIEEVRARLREQNIEPDKTESASFDSNVITPGTEFMTNLSLALQKWITKKLTTNDETGLWHKDLQVILSDSSVPGEGEHKIMDYLRQQRKSRNYNPNLRHCLYGADADLIMLGLATHENHFTILREEFKPFQPKPCELCRQFGHKLTECQGLKSLEEAKITPIVGASGPDFILIKLFNLKEALRRDMNHESYVRLDFERFIDDYIFLCFFVGNDFLPHLPSLDIRENAVDRLVRIYHNVNRSYWRPGMYLTNRGRVDLERCQEILHELGAAENEIFRKRKFNDQRYESRQLENKRARWEEEHPEGEAFPEPDIPYDYIRLGDNGWKDRYYMTKFGFKGHYRDIADRITREYVRGLCWVLAYYYEGCPDWQWFYPFHYAPFAEDMRSIMNIKLDFNNNAPPFKPLEQLMGVFPEKSASALPKSWRKLMSDPESPIIDFYPTNFKVDMNGKKQAYLGVVLLPFIDEARLFRALEKVYPDLTAEEERRNAAGKNFVFKRGAIQAANN
uniref:5'-3' exoribonuclease n=1 Tax=Aceria tosichella TaxID=561515 RepID=A0A6G1S3X0_9ACAR